MMAVVEFAGRTTVSTVIPEAGSLADGLVGTGIARCRPDDHFDDVVGEKIATARAVQDLGRAMEARSLLESIPESEYLMQDVTLTLINRQTGGELDRTMPRLAAYEVVDFAATLGIDLVAR